MKRFRPHCGGYIVLYALTLLSLGDTIFTAYSQIKGINESVTSFSLLSYLITAFALLYTWMYGRSQVAIDDASLRVASPMNIIPKPGEARASFVFRQGGGDIRFVDKTLRLDAITRYGYVEDLGYKQIDASQASERNKLFPVHEVAFITDDNKRYHMNAAIYSRQQRKEIFTLVRQRSGVDPTGRLLKELGE